MGSIWGQSGVTAALETSRIIPEAAGSVSTRFFMSRLNWDRFRTTAVGPVPDLAGRLHYFDDVCPQ